MKWAEILSLWVVELGYDWLMITLVSLGLFVSAERVNCHFGPCGLASFATLVQISNLLHPEPCGLHFVAILVQK
ncbi:hypothetical protein HanRHA438_Chr11g0493961 [Helianthus annuus]|nr:hypothetical protein HanRHA438_Chr11g0493961 [Helianthus annuus]